MILSPSHRFVSRDNPAVPQISNLVKPLSENLMMRKLTQKFVDFLKKEDGPTAVEYAVMLALIIVVCIAAITTLGSNANNTFSNVAAKATPAGGS
jgi:pilus assembly protein Flp/PilA